MVGDRFSSSTSCSGWLHETAPARPDPSLSCLFLKVATHPFNRLRVVGRVTARSASPVVPWLSQQVECREAPSNHSGDTRLRALASGGVDPRGSVAAVLTAQADREFGHAHAGMGAWMGQHLDGVHACLTPAGVARRDEHLLAPDID